MLSRRWLFNIALTIVIAGLVWAGLYFDTEQESLSNPRISTLKPADIDNIELQIGSAMLKLQRAGDGWRIVAPIEWPAQPDNVERLLSILSFESSAIADAADVDLAALGLQPPAASLYLDAQSLQFGATNNIGGRRYVMFESKLHLLPDVHLAFAAQGLPGIVDRRLLPGRKDIARLRLPQHQLGRDENGQWHSTPALAQADLQRLLTNWQTLSATRIKPFDLDSSPGDIIEVQFVDGHSIDFLLLASAPEIIIAHPDIGLQYHFRGDFLNQLIAPASDG